MRHTLIALALASFASVGFAQTPTADGTKPPPDPSTLPKVTATPPTPPTAQQKLMGCVHEFAPKTSEQGGKTVVTLGKPSDKNPLCAEVKQAGWEGSADGFKYNDLAKTPLSGVAASGDGTLTITPGATDLFVRPLLTADKETLSGFVVRVASNAPKDKPAMPDMPLPPKNNPPDAAKPPAK